MNRLILKVCTLLLAVTTIIACGNNTAQTGVDSGSDDPQSVLKSSSVSTE